MPQSKVKRTLPMSSVPIMHPALFHDDASGTFNYIVDATGAGYIAEYSTTNVHVGQKTIYLRTQPTTPQIGDMVSISKLLWLPPEKLLRLQVIWSPLSSSVNAYNTFYLTWLSGSRQYLAGLRSRTNTGEVWLASGFVGVAPTWTLRDDLHTPILSSAWSKLDLSVDWNTGKHHLLHFNEVALDLSDLDTPSQASVDASALFLYIIVETLQTSQASLFVDQLLLTPEVP